MAVILAKGTGGVGTKVSIQSLKWKQRSWLHCEGQLEMCRMIVKVVGRRSGTLPIVSRLHAQDGLVVLVPRSRCWYLVFLTVHKRQRVIFDFQKVKDAMNKP